MTDTQGTDLLQQAITALQGGIPGQARAILESLIEQGADSASVWGVLALACRDQEDMQAALAAAERSLSHEARNPRAMVVKGDAYYKLGDRQASAAFYREALNQLPKQAQLAEDMALEMDRARNRVEALAHDFADQKYFCFVLIYLRLCYKICHCLLLDKEKVYTLCVQCHF